jgi:hypothetical protein
MSKKRTKYTSAFKTKLALELLQNESTIVQIASKHNILSANLVFNADVYLVRFLLIFYFYFFVWFNGFEIRKIKLLSEIVGVL